MGGNLHTPDLLTAEEGGGRQEQCDVLGVALRLVGTLDGFDIDDRVGERVPTLQRHHIGIGYERLEGDDACTQIGAELHLEPQRRGQQLDGERDAASQCPFALCSGKLPQDALRRLACRRFHQKLLALQDVRHARKRGLLAERALHQQVPVQGVLQPPNHARGQPPPFFRGGDVEDVGVAHRLHKAQRAGRSERQPIEPRLVEPPREQARQRRRLKRRIPLRVDDVVFDLAQRRQRRHAVERSLNVFEPARAHVRGAQRRTVDER